MRIVPGRIDRSDGGIYNLRTPKKPNPINKILRYMGLGIFQAVLLHQVFIQQLNMMKQ